MEKKILAGFALTVAVLSTVGVLLWRSASEQTRTTAWVSQTYEVLNRLDHLVNYLSDAENGRRGYVLSGHYRYWVHHTNGVGHAERALRELRELTQDNLRFSAACDQLEEMIRRRLTISTNSIKARQDNGLDLRAQITFMEEGQQAMDPIRQLAAQLTREETARLKERQTTQEANVRGTTQFALIASTLSLGLFMGLFVLFWQESQRRRRAEEALQKTNQELEHRVTERTAELSRAIRTLQTSEGALTRERNLLRLLIDNLPAYIYLKDTEGRFLVYNTAAVRLVGAAAEAEVLGKTVFNFFPNEIAQLYDADDHQMFETGQPIFDREEPGQDREGNPRWFLTTKLPMRDGHGAMIGQLGITQDITERKQSERRLQTQLSRLDLLRHITRAIGERQDLQSMFQVVIRSLEDNLPIDFGSVCLYDATAEVLTVTTVGVRSGALAMELALTEQARIDIDQNGLARCVRGELVYEPDIARVTFPFPQRLARGGLHSMVAAPLRVESKVFGVLVAARRQSYSFSSADCEFLGQLSGHVALASHQAQLYTALQRSYDDLRQTQQAVLQQERLRALGQMASGIAHDINNAISPAALYTESLLEREPNLSERAREYLATIQRAIEDVAQTVTRMKEFYRQREPELALAPVQLNHIIEQVIEMTRARWSNIPQERGVVIGLQTELAPDSAGILGVEGEIRDALINLILNAVDAMPEGGSLMLRTRVISTEANRPEGALATHVRLEVCDTGVGMDEETRRRCLEPFFTTKGERGTGLGLAMVYGMVQRHSGEIEIESAPGKGTKVRLLFPASAGVAVRTARAMTAPRLLQRLRILIVDDDPLLLKSLRDTLEADGHLVSAAEGGQAGIDAFAIAQSRGEPFAVVITDLGMPYVDGRKVAASVKSTVPGTPVILLTGWGQRLTAEGDVPPHVDRVLNKPPKLCEMRTALAELVGHVTQAKLP